MTAISDLIGESGWGSSWRQSRYWRRQELLLGDGRRYRKPDLELELVGLRGVTLLRGLVCATSWIFREAVAGGQLKRGEGARREERRRRNLCWGSMGGGRGWEGRSNDVLRASDRQKTARPVV